MTLPETFNPRSTHWPRGLNSRPVPLIALCSRQTGFHTVLVSFCLRALAYATLMPSPLALRLRRIFLFLPRGPAMAAPEASCPGSTCDRRCRCDVLRLPSTQPRPPAPVGLQTAPGPEVRGFSTAAHGRGVGGCLQAVFLRCSCQPAETISSLSVVRGQSHPVLPPLSSHRCQTCVLSHAFPLSFTGMNPFASNSFWVCFLEDARPCCVSSLPPARFSRLPMPWEYLLPWFLPGAVPGQTSLPNELELLWKDRASAAPLGSDQACIFCTKLVLCGYWLVQLQMPAAVWGRQLCSRGSWRGAAEQETG